jgi:hypothetical protein
MNTQYHNVNPKDHSSISVADNPKLQESRSKRFNLPVRHPAKWRFLMDLLLSSPMRIHRYRNLTTRMFEDTMNDVDCGSCK